MSSYKHRVFVFMVLQALSLGAGAARAEDASKKQTLNVLFIGNSYTARHNLPQLVKAMAEAGNPELTFNPTAIIYGGRRLLDHWQLGTQNYAQLHSLTRAQQKATIAELEQAASDPDNRYAKTALARHRQLLSELDEQRTKWDVIVLQSYRDDLEGGDSLFAQFAPKFARLAKAQGARVILYETTPTTQNAEPLRSPPSSTAVMRKAREIATLAARIDGAAAPMSLVGYRCQNERPDLTLRFVNDAHLNQTMAYLTACALYAALFDRSPEGLPVDAVTDIRFQGQDRSKDRDGQPITKTFSQRDRADLQRIAWEGHQQFQQLLEEARAPERGSEESKSDDKSSHSTWP